MYVKDKTRAVFAGKEHLKNVSSCQTLQTFITVFAIAITLQIAHTHVRTTRYEQAVGRTFYCYNKTGNNFRL